MKRTLAYLSVAAGLLGVSTLGATAAPLSPVGPVSATEHSQIEKVYERRYHRRHHRRHHSHGGPVVVYGAPYRSYGYYNYGYRPYGYASVGLPFIHLDIGGRRHHRHHRHW